MPSRDRKVLTLHAPLGRAVAHGLVKQIEDSLKEMGASRVWISADDLPNLTLMASMEDEA